jgi:hypothetical protein
MGDPKMAISQLALAVVLLTSPPETLQLHDPAAVFHFVAPTLRNVAMQMELLDVRETEHLKNQQDFLSDLALLQGRYVELGGTPSAKEVSRFPSKALADSLIEVNQRYKESLNSLLELDALHADAWRVILAETQQLFEVYDTIRQAQGPYYVTYRRQQLARLRELIGAEAFCTGQLPPHVPIWRIPEAQ